MPDRFRRRPRHFLMATGTVLLAVLIKMLVGHNETPFLFLPAAVMISAWYGGTVPGLFAMVLASFSAAFFFLPPEYTFLIYGGSNYLRMGMFLVEGLLICLLAGALHSTRYTAVASREEAEDAYTKSQRTVSELLRTKDALLASETRFRRLVEANIIGVFVIDSEGYITHANDAFLRMVGYGKEDTGAAMLSSLEMTPPEFADFDVCARNELRMHGKCQAYEKEFIRKDGRRVPVLLGAARLEGDKGHAVCFALDLTQQKQTEMDLQSAMNDAESANRSKGDFLANISHELRTPMNAIIGMTELTLDDDISDSVRDNLITVRESAASLLRLLNDLLDFSKLEAGKFDFARQPFRLRETLDDTLKALSVPAYEQGLEIVCHVENNVPDNLIGDATRVRQVMTNLVSNGLKFTEQGEVAVSVRVESRTQQDVCLQICVKDTGIGISVADQNRIFAPFTQADASSTRKYHGTGLGLAIATELISMMGGRLWVESEPGVGSRFYFTARFPVADEEVGPRTTSSQEELLPQLRGLPVLVVDDNESNLRILEESLIRWELSPTLVANGEAALARLEAAAQSQPYPVVIVDALMPGMDGFTLARRIKENRRLAKSVILMLSSADRREFAERCADLEIAAYLEKPIVQSELLDAIATAVFRNESPAKELSAPPATQRTLSELPRCVLLAEDTLANQKVVVAILQRRGHKVMVAHNGREAIDRCYEEAFDIILMDVQMPTMDGFQATAAIRGLEPGEAQTSARVPIVAMTAHAMPGDREKCLSAGMDGYLSKPIDAAKLVRIVENVPVHARHAATSAKASGQDQVNTTDTTGNGRQQPVGVAAEVVGSATTEVIPPLINMEAAVRRLGGDRQLLTDTVEYFIEDAPELLERVDRHLAAGESNEASRAAHSLKGLAANFDAKAVVDAAFTVEQLANDGKLPSAVTAADALRAETMRLFDALEPYRRGAGE